MDVHSRQMNREILRLAVPNIISNISVPLLGMVGTAIAGRLGDDVNIASLAIGTTIFNFIYWNCAFLRMGSSGITAQAFGAGNRQECANMLIRSLWLAFAISLLLLVFQKPVGNFALDVMNGSGQVRTLAAAYFHARIWAAPATITLFAIHGWFIGMQDAKTPMWIAIISNVVNAVFSWTFAFRLDMGIAGIAWGTVVAQYTGLLLSFVFLFVKYRGYLRHINLEESLRIAPIMRFLQINKDIFLRTFCVVVVYTFFTRASAGFNEVVLTTNSLLMQLFTLFSYMIDGFAYAAESLTGRFVGERNMSILRLCMKRLLMGGLAIGVLFVFIYVIAWKEILMLFSPSEATIACAGEYIGWIISVPLVGCVPFIIDGIMIGATQTRLLRNTVFLSTLAYFAVFYALSSFWGNSALWLAFITFLAMRGILLYFCSGKLDVRRIIDA